VGSVRLRRVTCPTTTTVGELCIYCYFGQVVCGKCSSKKSNLAYDNNRPNRVCDKCFSILKNVDGKEVNEKTPKGVLKVSDGVKGQQ
jgi:hypothetical protein